jgi:hypothetical protein
MFKRLRQLWRLLTNLALPPDPQPGPLALEMVCQVCEQSFQQPVERLYVDLAAARQYQHQNRTTVAHDEVSMPDPVTCPHCGAVDHVTIRASAYMPIGTALLRFRFGPYGPDEPIQFINLSAKSANSSRPRPKHPSSS